MVQQGKIEETAANSVVSYTFPAVFRYKKFTFTIQYNH